MLIFFKFSLSNFVANMLPKNYVFDFFLGKCVSTVKTNMKNKNNKTVKNLSLALFVVSIKIQWVGLGSHTATCACAHT